MRIFWSFLVFFSAISVWAQPTLRAKLVCTDPFMGLGGVEAIIYPGQLKTTFPNDEFVFVAPKAGHYRIEIKNIRFRPFQQQLLLLHDTTIQIVLEPMINMKDEVVIEAKKNMANVISTESLNSKQIKTWNNGQDIPYLMQQMTSVQVGSDAGAGIGYTNMSVRGSDGTRINVSLNGVPLNDAESHGAFWVNLPDFSSGASQVSLQRGIGASANGVAAFGANLSVQTNQLRPEAYAEINNSAGSFNTIKNTLMAGTGLINDHFTLDMRLSNITSDGYIDRASSNLKSYFVSAGWYVKNSIIKYNHFTGKEKTYQAWNGVPQDTLLVNRTYNEFYYKNQTDNYTQQHHQLFYSYQHKNWLLHAGAHYTYGTGYYEEYKQDQSLADYGLLPVTIGLDTIANTDLIRRRWLANDFAGALYTITKNAPEYHNSNRVNVKLVLGGAANVYLGNHFGEVIWSRFASNGYLGQHYYNDNAQKQDINQYLKADIQLPHAWTIFTDLQYRYVNYRFSGFNDFLVPEKQTAQYHFFNPKIGLMRQRHTVYSGFNTIKLLPYSYYIFYAMGHREPIRIDFVNSTPSSRPKPESMHNLEAGFDYQQSKFSFKINYYLQYYLNQLVLTGQINDVGAYTRTNVDKSYRTGVEVEASIKPIERFTLTGNVTLSKNKIMLFSEYLDNYDNGTQQQRTYRNTDIGFSPSVLGAAGILYRLPMNMETAVNFKYVGKQFLDNTSNETRMLTAYHYSNLVFSKTIDGVRFKSIKFGVQVNNLYNSLYESNGYTYSYIFGGIVFTQNFYYPQAGINYLGFCNIAF